MPTTPPSPAAPTRKPRVSAPPAYTSAAKIGINVWYGVAVTLTSASMGSSTRIGTTFQA
jgi:hypothetical protein